MAVLRLELDIDSDVYPELYDKLAAIVRPAARDERVRQLAQAGLVWETVRLHGLPSPPAPAPASAAASASPAPVRSSPRAAPKPAPKPPPRPPAPRPRVASDFVDLAISAVPPPPEEAGEADDAPGPVPHAATGGALPVLMDVVDALQAAPSVTAPAALSIDEPPARSLPVSVDHVDEAAQPLESHRPAPRSRLMRMKERGLFKNG